MSRIVPLAAFNGKELGARQRRPSVTFCYIHDLDTRACIASAGFTDFITHSWPWVQQTVAAHYDCAPDDVKCIESDDGDRITVRGKPVAFLAD
jgi:hypothetical protein